MKLSVLLPFVLLFSAPVFAQTIIERSDYTLSLDGETVNNWALSASGVSLPAEGNGVIWDYSGQTILNSYLYTKEAVSDPLFPEANLVEKSIGNALGVVPQDVHFYEVLDDEGYRVIGRTTSEVIFPSQPITGGPNDTIAFLGSVSTYGEPRYYLKFPLAYQDSWETDLDILGDYLMTVAVFGLDHVPASSKYSYATVQTVVGDGTLILPHPDGAGTVSMPALLLKTETTRVDSFFLAGQPAPQLMLDALNLQQGETTNIVSYGFYAKGLNRSACQVEISGGAVSEINMADEIKSIVSSTRFVAEDLLDALVYPNPTSGPFQLAFDKPDARPWTLDLYNALGQSVVRQVLQGPSGPMTVEVAPNRDLQPGLYQVALRNAEKVLMVSERVLME